MNSLKPDVRTLPLQLALLAMLSPTTSTAEFLCGVERGNLHNYIGAVSDKFTCTAYERFEIGPNVRSAENNVYAFYAKEVAFNGPVSFAPGDVLLVGLPNKRRLTDTGITSCSNSAENGMDCPIDFYPGQDAEHGRDTEFDFSADGQKGFSYTPINLDGTIWRGYEVDTTLSQQRPSCIKDNVTGLIWERKVPEKDCPLVPPRTTCTLDTYTWDEAQDHLDALNKYDQGAEEGLCGLTQWRLPTRSELRSLADYETPFSAPFGFVATIDPDYFPYTQPYPYWSSDQDPYETDYFWLIDFAYGEVNWDFKDHSKHVRAVHDPLWMPPALPENPPTRPTCDPSIPRSTDPNEFFDHGDGTITHKLTGLMWKKCVEGKGGSNCDQDIPDTPDTYTWRWALQQADESNFAGYDDWRLPNIKELASIVEISCYNPAIDTRVFPNDPGSRIWSSSSYVNYVPYQWVMNFAHGIDEQIEKSGEHLVRLVRGAVIKKKEQTED